MLAADMVQAAGSGHPGRTGIAGDDVAGRFTAYGWQVQRVADGNDLSAVDAALRSATADDGAPAPGPVVLARLGISPERIRAAALDVMAAVVPDQRRESRS